MRQEDCSTLWDAQQKMLDGRICGHAVCNVGPQVCSVEQTEGDWWKWSPMAACRYKRNSRLQQVPGPPSSARGPPAVCMIDDQTDSRMYRCSIHSRNEAQRTTSFFVRPLNTPPPQRQSTDDGSHPDSHLSTRDDSSPSTKEVIYSMLEGA